MVDQPVHRVLIFNVNWIGDVLFSTATIRNIRRNYPGAYIACIIPPRCASVLKGNPHLNEVILFDERGEHGGMLQQMKFVYELKMRRFDTVFLLHRSMSRALLCRLAGIKERVGYLTKKRGFLLTRGIRAPGFHSMHRIEYYLHLIKEAGLTIFDRHTEFFFSADDERKAGEFLESAGHDRGKPLVGINPGGNWGPKRWPKENWHELASLLAKAGCDVVISGSPQDQGLAQEISAGLDPAPMSACEALDLSGFAALSARMSLFISADTGPLHIVNAVGKARIIALFGPTDVKVTGPYPPGKSVVIQKPGECQVPCYKESCADYKCMSAITPQEVFSQALEALKRPAGGQG